MYIHVYIYIPIWKISMCPRTTWGGPRPPKGADQSPTRRLRAPPQDPKLTTQWARKALPDPPEIPQGPL